MATPATRASALPATSDVPASRRLLQAKRIGVGLNVTKLLRREIDVQSVLIDGATVDLFTDGNGGTNFNILKPRPPGAPAPGRGAPAVLVRDVAEKSVRLFRSGA